MRSRIVSLLLVVVMIGSFAVFSKTLVGALGFTEESEIVTEAIPAEFLPKERAVSERSEDSLPVRFLIPKLGIDTNAQHVGVTASGAMATPKGFTEVAWYKYGPVPGEEGSAVVAGHFDDALGRDGVFKKLDLLEPGDLVTVVFADGSTAQFAVRGKSRIPYSSPNTAEIFSSTEGVPHLNLVTCVGAWVKSSRTYAERLVVFTDLVEEPLR